MMNRSALLAAGVLGILVAAGGCGRPQAAPPSAAGSTAPPTVPASGPAPTTAGPPTGAAGADCGPEDLDPHPTYSDGAAMGSHGQEVVVRNTGRVPCRLAVYPVLLYTDSSGAVRTMPAADHAGQVQEPVTLAPGGSARFVVLTVNGLGGYQPDSPDCAHPQEYRDMYVVLAGDRRYRLPGFRVSFTCGQPRIQPWTPVTDSTR